MNSVKMRKAELVKIVSDNMKAHKEVVEEAIIAYRAKVIEELDKSLKDAKAGRQFRTFIQLEEPVNMTAAYERVLRMLKHSVDKYVTLTAREYENYVMDRWDWTNQFTVTNSVYTSKAIK